MLFKDYRKSYVEFCEEEIAREIVLAKRRYLRKEKALRMQCTLNEYNALGVDVDKLDMLVGDEDVILEGLLPLEEIIEDENIAKSMKLLSDKEKKVVSLRLDAGMTVKEINIVLNTNRPSTSSDIYQRAIKKIRKNIEESKGE